MRGEDRRTLTSSRTHRADHDDVGVLGTLANALLEAGEGQVMHAGNLPVRHLVGISHVEQIEVLVTVEQPDQIDGGNRLCRVT